MYSIMTLLSPEQRQRGVKQYSIPVRDTAGTIVSYRCFDGGDIWYELFKEQTGNYEKNSLTIGEVLQLAGLPVQYDNNWNVIITPEIEPYYLSVWEITDLNDSGQLRSWRNVRGILNDSTTNERLVQTENHRTNRRMGS